MSSGWRFKLLLKAKHYSNQCMPSPLSFIMIIEVVLLVRGSIL